MKVVQFCPDDCPTSGVNTFASELNAALVRAGVDSRLVRTTDKLDTADVVHIHGLWLKPMHQAFVWAKKNGLPVVWSTHGMTAPWAMKHKWWKKLPAWLLYQRKDLRGADLIHATTELERSWNGTLRQIVIPLGTHLPKGESPAGAGATRTLLFVGRIHPVKAIDRIIAAFQRAPHAGWRLRIVGPDEVGYRKELEKIAGPDVDFVGSRLGADLVREYAACDCAILASHTENFGATIVDALAHGKPVIAGTRTPWQVVAETGCGWWVENDAATLAKAIGEMAALTDERRAEMGARGRKLVEEKYTWSAVAKAMAKAYAEVCRG